MQRSVMRAVHPPLARAIVATESTADIEDEHRRVGRGGTLVASKEAAAIDAMFVDLSVLNKQG